MKVILELDLDINEFNNKFEKDLSKGHALVGKKKEKYEAAKDAIEDAKEQIQNYRNLLKKKSIGAEQDEKYLHSWQNKLKKSQTEIRKLNAERRGFKKVPQEFVTFKSSFGQFRISKRVLIKNLGNTANLIKQRQNREIRKYVRKEKDAIDIARKTKNPTVAKFKEYKDEIKYRENNIAMFESIYEQIKNDPDYPMFYDYFPETTDEDGNRKDAYFDLHIIGFRGIKKFNKKKAERTFKFGKGHKAAPR